MWHKYAAVRSRTCMYLVFCQNNDVTQRVNEALGMKRIFSIIME